MSQDLIKAERAALIQAVKALYIPLSLFIACVISAGGMYMVLYTEDKSPGYAFLGIALTIIISAFIALIRFQNSYRAKGLVGRAEATGEPEITDIEDGQSAESAALSAETDKVGGEKVTEQKAKENATKPERATSSVR